MLARREFLRSCAIASAAGTFAGTPFVRATRANAGPDIGALSSKLTGYVLVPGDKLYNDAREPFSFNPRTDAYPLAIVVCKSEDDVARSIAFARTNALPLAVRGGAHDVLGASTVNGGIVVAVAGLNGVADDPKANTVTLGAGLRSGKVNTALQTTGRAVALGCNPQVGISGLALGGGLGWLLGTAGASADNLLRARIVTADGRVLGVDEQTEPDLFWAIRGGGGNFGIATSFTLRTHRVDKVVGGWIVYPGERLGDVLKMYREAMQSAPPELVVELASFHASRPLAVAMVCYRGDVSKADAVLAPFRKTIAPLADDVALAPYATFNDPGPGASKLLASPPSPKPAPEAPDSPGIYWMGASLDTLSDGAIDAILSALQGAPAGGAFSLGHYMHGALCDVAPEATPLLRSRGRMTYHFDTGWGNVKHAAECMDWVDASLAAMQQYSTAPVYVNYLGSDAVEAVRKTYGPNYERLLALKKRYDPDNVFQRNRNIRP